MTDLSKKTNLLADGFAMGESPRWHDGQLWFSDWGAREIIALDPAGRRVTTVAVPFALPFCLDWHPDGSLLVVAGREAQVMRWNGGTSFVHFADLGEVSTNPWNEIVIDHAGNAYVNSAAAIALVTPEGKVRKVADGGQFPNGMAITSDHRTLLMAESHGQCITAFDIEADGRLANRRVWAELSGYPDGVCLDGEGALWYADVPNRMCARIREGGKILDTVRTDRGCFSCVLGGMDGRTLFIAAAEWRGMDKIAEVAAARTAQVLTVTVRAGRGASRVFNR